MTPQAQRIACAESRKTRTVTIYRDDSTTQVVYDKVKHFFWLANNSVLCLAVYSQDEGDVHHYIHWPRERFCWFKDVPNIVTAALRATGRDSTGEGR